MSEGASAGSPIDALLDAAEEALEQGSPADCITLCAQVLESDPHHPGAWFVRGDALRMLGLLPDAARAYHNAAMARPDHASSWASYALTSLDLRNLEEARRASSRAIREDAANPEGWWVRGLIAEWSGDLPGARRAQAQARWLDPMTYPLPLELTDEDVEDLVQEALLELHPAIRGYLTNVAILLEDMPRDEDLDAYDPPISPLELLGCFSGPSLMERNTEDPWSQLPPTIVLYRRNIARKAVDRDELVYQLQVTLFHEIGHFLGLSEQDLEDRGLE